MCAQNWDTDYYPRSSFWYSPEQTSAVDPIEEKELAGIQEEK